QRACAWRLETTAPRRSGARAEAGAGGLAGHPWREPGGRRLAVAPRPPERAEGRQPTCLRALPRVLPPPRMAAPLPLTGRRRALSHRRRARPARFRRHTRRAPPGRRSPPVKAAPSGAWHAPRPARTVVGLDPSALTRHGWRPASSHHVGPQSDARHRLLYRLSLPDLS